MKARVSIHGRRRRARRTRVVFLVVWAQGVWISKKIMIRSASDCDSDVQVAAASSTRAKWIHLPGLPGASSARRRPSDY